MAPAPTDFSTLSLHDALPICAFSPASPPPPGAGRFYPLARTESGGEYPRRLEGYPGSRQRHGPGRSEEHTSELQSRPHLVCRLLLEKKKHKTKQTPRHPRTTT